MGSSVDTRVVELEFDNSRFESGVQTSLDTLKTLERNLDFSKNISGAEQLQSALKSVDLDDVTQKASGLKGAFVNALTGVSDTILGIRDRIAEVGSTGKLVTTALTGGVVALAATGGMKRALNIEQARFQIEGLGTDFAEVNSQISDAVSGTAYGYDEAARAASQFLASGVEVGDQMYKSLRAISGVAAMTNDSYSNIGDIFTKIAAQNAIMGGELRQLSMRGFAAADMLASYFNDVNNGTAEASESVKASVAEVSQGMEVAASDIYEWASDRLIDFDMFSEAMFQKFGEYAGMANKTLTGSTANVKAVFSRIGEAFITPFNQMLTLINQGLLGDKEGLFGEAWIGPLRQVEALVKSIAPLWVEIANISGNVIYKFLQFLGKSNVIGGLAEHVSVLFTGLADGLKIGETAIDKIAKAAWIGFSGFIELFKSLGSYISPLVAAVTDVFDLKFPNFRSLITLFDTAAKNFKTWATTLRLSDESSEKLKTRFTTILKLVANISDTLAKGFGLLLAVVTPIVSGLLSIVGSTVSTTLQTISSVFSDMGFNLKNLNKFLEFSTDVFERFFKMFETGDVSLDKAATSVSNIGDEFEKFFEKTEHFAWVGDIFKFVSDRISDLMRFLEYAGGKLSEYGITFENVGRFFTEIGSIVGEFLSVFSNGVPDMDSFSAAISNMGGRFSDFFGKVGGKLGPFVEKISEFIGNLVGNGLGFVSEGFGGFIGSLSEIFGPISNIVLPDSLSSLLEFPAKLGEAFKHGFGGSDRLSGDVSKIVGVADAVAQASESLNRTAESTGLSAVSEYLKTLNDTATGTESAFDNIGKVISDIVTKITEWVSSLDQTNFLIAISGLFTGGFLISLMKAFKAVKTIGDGVSKIFKWADTLGQDLHNILTNVGSAITAFSDMLGSFGDAAKTMAKAELLKSFAISVGILVASLWVLSTIPKEELQKSVLALAAVSGILLVLSIAMSKLGSDVKESAAMAGSLLGFAAALVVLAVAAKMLAAMNLNDLVNVVVAATGLVVVAALLGAISKKFSGNVLGLGLSLLAFSVSLTVLSAACRTFAGVSVEMIGKTALAIVALSVAMLALGFAADVASAKDMLAISVAMIALSASLHVIAGAIQVLGSMDLAQLGVGLLAVLLLITAMGAGLAAAGQVGVDGIAGILAMTGALIVLSGVVTLLGLIPWQITAQGILVMAAALGVLLLAGAIAGIKVISAGLMTLASSIAIIGVGVGAAGLGLIAFAAGLTILAAMAPSAFAAISMGIQILLTGLTETFFKMQEVAVVGILGVVQTMAANAPAFATAMVVIVRTGLAALQELLPEFGETGAMAISTFALALGSQVGQLASAGILMIVGVLLGIAASMGLIIQAAFEVMVGFINGLADCIGSPDNQARLGDAFANLISAAISAAVNAITGLPGFVGQIVEQLVDNVSDNTSEAEAAGTKVGEGITAGIEAGVEKTPEVVESAIDDSTLKIEALAANAMNVAGGMGEGMLTEFDGSLSGMPDVTDSILGDTTGEIQGMDGQFKTLSENLGLSATDGLGSGMDGMSSTAKSETSSAISEVRSQSGSANSAGYSVGSSMASGLKIGFDRNIEGLSKKAADSVRNAMNAAKKESDSRSPSRKMMKIGRWMAEGLIIGMEQMQKQVASVGKASANAVMDPFYGISGMISSSLSDVDYEPVIRPVVDLSGVRSGVGAMNGYFTNNRYAASYVGAPLGAGYLGGNVSTSNVVNITLNPAADASANDMVLALARELKVRNILEG